MPDLFDELLKRQAIKPGTTSLPEQTTLPTIGQRLFEGGIDTLLGLIGAGPETTANKVGQVLGAGIPMFKFGGKALKMGPGGKWQLLDEAQTERALNGLKQTDPMQSVRSMDELAFTMPPVRDLNKPPIGHIPTKAGAKPKGNKQPTKQISGKWSNNSDKVSRSLSKSKLNTSMVLDIRRRGKRGVSIATLQKQYPEVTDNTIREIIKGESWGWVK